MRRLTTQIDPPPPPSACTCIRLRARRPTALLALVAAARSADGHSHPSSRQAATPRGSPRIADQPLANSRPSSRTQPDCPPRTKDRSVRLHYRSCQARCCRAQAAARPPCARAAGPPRRRNAQSGAHSTRTRNAGLRKMKPSTWPGMPNLESSPVIASGPRQSASANTDPTSSDSRTPHTDAAPMQLHYQRPPATRTVSPRCPASSRPFPGVRERDLATPAMHFARTHCADRARSAQRRPARAQGRVSIPVATRAQPEDVDTDHLPCTPPCDHPSPRLGFCTLPQAPLTASSTRPGAGRCTTNRSARTRSPPSLHSPCPRTRPPPSGHNRPLQQRQAHISPAVHRAFVVRTSLLLAEVPVVRPQLRTSSTRRPPV